MKCSWTKSVLKTSIKGQKKFSLLFKGRKVPFKRFSLLNTKKMTFCRNYIRHEVVNWAAKNS